MSIFDRLFRKVNDSAMEKELAAQPISKIRMDLLWMNDSGLRVLEASIRAGREHTHIMSNGEGDLRELKVTLDDIVWVNKVNGIAEKAAAASQRKDYWKAIRLYREALRLAPGCDQWLNSIGSCYVHMDQPEKGLRYIKRALEVSSQPRQIEENLAKAKKMCAQLEEVPSPSQVTVSLKRCAICGSEVSKGEIACSNCGSGIFDSPKKQVVQLKTKYSDATPRNVEEAIDRINEVLKMEYFEVPRPSGDGRCSDNACPCPEVIIPRGTGYLYICPELLDFRRDCHTYAELQIKLDRMARLDNSVEKLGADVSIRILPPGTSSPILMCEQGAKLRGLDLAVATADAKHWWETGLVPLRATPLAKKS